MKTFQGQSFSLKCATNELQGIPTQNMIGRYNYNCTRIHVHTYAFLLYLIQQYIKATSMRYVYLCYNPELNFNGFADETFCGETKLLYRHNHFFKNCVKISKTLL